MKKKLLLVICLLAGAAMLFAGGQKSSGKTLTVWDFKYSEEVTGKAFKEMDDMFVAQNPGVTINHVAQPEPSFYQLLMSAFVAKTDVDVVILHADNRAWNLADFFEVLDPHITAEMKNYATPSLKAVSATQDPTKNIKMLPLTVQGIGFYYNKANFTRAGLDPNKVPSSWNDFLAACEALKKANIPPVIMGNAGMPIGIDFALRVILATLYGPNRIEGFRNGTANFTDPEFRQAALMVKELYNKGYINVENASINYFMDAIDAFKAGQGGFIPGLCSDIAHWKDYGEALGYNNVGYFPSPVAQGAAFPNAQINQGAGLGMAVINYGKNKDIAVQYVKHYTSGKGGQVFLNASGAIVPNTTVPVDASIAMLNSIMDKLNTNGVGDFMTLVPGGVVNDLQNLMVSYFISDELTIDEYVRRSQETYRNGL
jgi:ABC-type glycerol-3-phosphate transport system substrate-binding protein